MHGRGEQLAEGPALPPLPVVLLNPSVPVATAAVFARLAQRTGAILPRLPDTIEDAAHLAVSIIDSTKPLMPNP